jgi:regulator of RNase E activity RraA
VQLPIACGGVSVYPGDAIVGDSDGVIVIPRHLAEEAARRALEQERRERFILSKVAGGASIIGVYPPNAETLAEYERSQRQT